MTPHQKEQLQKNFKDNQAFFGLYTQDLAALRQMRIQALDVCVKMPRLKNEDGTLPHVTIDQIISDAEKVFSYLTQDGSLESLSESPIVQTGR